jgi:hypothetical protein
MLDSLIIKDGPPNSTNPGSAVGVIKPFDAMSVMIGGLMKSPRQLEILALAPPSIRMSKESESKRARWATACPGLAQYAWERATPMVTAENTIAVAWLCGLAIWRRRGKVVVE